MPSPPPIPLRCSSSKPPSLSLTTMDPAYHREAPPVHTSAPFTIALQREPLDRPPIRPVAAEGLEVLWLKLWTERAIQFCEDMFAWMEAVEELRETCALVRDEPTLRDWFESEIGMIERRKDIELLNVKARIIFEAIAKEQALMQTTATSRSTGRDPPMGVDRFKSSILIQHGRWECISGFCQPVCHRHHQTHPRRGCQRRLRWKGIEQDLRCIFWVLHWGCLYALRMLVCLLSPSMILGPGS